jgi:hypothetical protein
MIIFKLMIMGSWIGFGYGLGTNNLVAEILFPIIAIGLSFLAAAFEVLQPVELEKAGNWEDE